LRKIDARFYKLGHDKNGDPKQNTITLPKKRLTVSEANFLKLFARDNTPRPTVDLLVEYKGYFEDEKITIAQASCDLKVLRENGFLQSVKGVPTMVNRHERRYITSKKTLYSLSELAKSGKLAVDAGRWLVFDGVYIADEQTRAKVTLKELAKLRLCALPLSPLQIALQRHRGVVA